MQSTFASWNNMHPQSCDDIKKKREKENCSNISHICCSYFHAQVCSQLSSTCLTMVRLQTTVCPGLTKYKVALRCTLFMFSYCSTYSLYLCRSGFCCPHLCSPYTTILTFMTYYQVSSHNHTGIGVTLITWSTNASLPQVNSPQFLCLVYSAYFPPSLLSHNERLPSSALDQMEARILDQGTGKEQIQNTWQRAATKHCTSIHPALPWNPEHFQQDKNTHVVLYQCPCKSEVCRCTHTGLPNDTSPE